MSEPYKQPKQGGNQTDNTNHSEYEPYYRPGSNRNDRSDSNNRKNMSFSAETGGNQSGIQSSSDNPEAGKSGSEILDSLKKGAAGLLGSIQQKVSSSGLGTGESGAGRNKQVASNGHNTSHRSGGVNGQNTAHRTGASRGLVSTGHPSQSEKNSSSDQRHSAQGRPSQGQRSAGHPSGNGHPGGQHRKKKKGRLRIGRLMMLVVPAILIPVLLGVGVYRLFNPLKLRAKEYVVEYKEDSFEPLDNVKSLFLGNKNNIEVTGNVDSSKIGDYAMVYSYKGRQYPFVVKVADTKGPELTVKNVTTDTASDVSADNFVENVSDTSEYTLKLDNPENEKKAGKHKVTIIAEDAYGNKTTKKATLKRTEDKKAPVIEEFAETKTVLQGDTFVADKLAAVDELDPNPSVTPDTSEVNMDVPGTYEVTYTATDRSGNSNVYTQQVTVQENPDYGKKVAYFTFDDGPSENTRAVLDALDQYDAKATFFVTGLNPDYYDLMKEIVDRGHTIALHTFSHDYAQVYSSEEAYLEDLQKIHDLVLDETGVDADCIRFPGGSSNMVSTDYSTGIMTELTKKVRDLGYQYFDWNADSTDASGQNIPASVIAANAISYIGEDEVNMLFHDANGKETTAEALPQILQAYADAGYVFRGVRSTGFAPHHDVNN